MIIRASRRTDVPAFYADGFFDRIKEEHVLVRNPMNYHQVNRVKLTPDVVDGIVFWTKNPSPLIYGNIVEGDKIYEREMKSLKGGFLA